MKFFLKCHSCESRSPENLKILDPSFRWGDISRMKYFLALILSFFVTTISAETPADKLSTLLGDLQTLQASFVQTLLNKQGANIQPSSGKMSLQRPGKFRWETRTPSHQLLVADGKNIWFYDQDLEQVTVQPQAHTEENSPAMLLSGSIPALSEKFTITSQPAPEGEWFLLVSKNKNRFFQSVKLRFKDHRLQEMYLTDNLGQSSHLQFTAVENNPTLPNALFRFLPPKNVDVIRE